MESEIQKRENIANNFQEHIKSIGKQMEEEIESMKCVDTQEYKDEESGETKTREIHYENEILRENAQLEVKYQDLMKEIAEKSELMD
jgi:hypothetical protein